MEVSIRKAMKKDLPEILELVKDLAEYENASSAVTVELRDYEEGFKNGSFDAIVAESKGKLAGMALYYDTFSTWKGKMVYLEDFVVKPELRGKGIGQMIFNRFISLAKEQNARLVKWEVLDWNKPAIQFYKKQDVVFDKEWWNCKVYF